MPCSAKVRKTDRGNATATLSDLVAQQAQKTPEASALADAHYHFTYREMREQVVALAYA
ncbi:hypothetical protein HIN51_24570, partial [Salmonella enterica subsp. enterica serovar Dublin]|nr:hypothetical protein [Salmonella enterica subsp. enterica serovar Dublin]